MAAPSRTWFSFGAVACAAGVGLGAWHAHGLKERLGPDDFQAFGRALDYQFQAAVGLMLLGLLGAQSPRLLRWGAGGALAVGMLFFSGTIYLRALSGWEAATKLAPMGGSLQILGWLLLAAAGWKARGRSA